MKKRTVTGLIAAGLILFGIVASSGSSQSPELESIQRGGAVQGATKVTEKIKPACDGTNVTAGCVFEGVNYKTYIYHPAVPEKTHTETETTYKEEVVGYCTLCNDGTYSPSCATGRGACSHHGGVAEWNAPRTRQVPVNVTKTVVDAQAREAYYEKVTE